MRRDWDLRARSDPLHAIDATRRGWDVDDFYARGPALVAAIVDPALRRLGVDPAGMRVLEIGCGIGRLFAGLSERFAEVWGIDISATMIEQGRQRCPVEAVWLVGDGASLTGVADGSVDHVISYEVFQHVPHRSVIESYQREIMRVLRPGATFQVQMRSGSDSRRQAIVRHLPRSLRVAVGAGLRALGVLGVGGDVDTWLGCVVPPAEAVVMVEELGFADVDRLPDDRHAPGMGYWVVGRRPPGTTGHPVDIDPGNIVRCDDEESRGGS
jgi:SAM-dependent methyltransferase